MNKKTVAHSMGTPPNLTSTDSEPLCQASRPFTTWLTDFHSWGAVIVLVEISQWNTLKCMVQLSSPFPGMNVFVRSSTGSVVRFLLFSLLDEKRNLTRITLLQDYPMGICSEIWCSGPPMLWLVLLLRQLQALVTPAMVGSMVVLF